jgi:predicted dehydrogenase
MVAHTLRWNATIRALAARIPDLGHLRLLAVAQRLESQERGDWLDRDVGGDVLLNTGVHGFDLVRHLAGREVERVWCRSERVQTRRQPDVFVAGLRMTGGLLATVDNCRATAARSGRIEVVGERGALVADQVHGTLSLQEGRGERPLPVPEEVPTVAAVLADFRQVILEGASNPVPVADGLAAVAVALACRQASESGAEVAVEPF